MEVCKEMWSQNAFDDIALDSDKGDALLRLLDTVVIKLEGGTELDLKVCTLVMH